MICQVSKKAIWGASLKNDKNLKIRIIIYDSLSMIKFIDKKVFKFY